MTLWFISDTHFGHENIITYCNRRHPEQDWKFHSADEMDEYLIEQWNAVVRPEDHIYHLGDVAMRQQAFHAVMPRLVGKKRLVRGNHDIFKTRTYLRFFEEIHACRVFDGLLFTHIPIHPESLGRFKANVHGHTHEKPPFGPRYVNISCEHTAYRPISLEEVQARAEAA